MFGSVRGRVRPCTCSSKRSSLRNWPPASRRAKRKNAESSVSLHLQGEVRGSEGKFGCVKVCEGCVRVCGGEGEEGSQCTSDVWLLSGGSGRGASAGRAGPASLGRPVGGREGCRGRARSQRGSQSGANLEPIWSQSQGPGCVSRASLDARCALRGKPDARPRRLRRDARRGTLLRVDDDRRARRLS